MSLMFIALAAANVAAAQPAPATPALECRRAGSTNGARVGRKICKTPAEWADKDRDTVMAFGPMAGTTRTVGDPDSRTMSRPLQVR